MVNYVLEKSSWKGEDSFSFVSVEFEILRRNSSKDLKEDTDVRV